MDVQTFKTAQGVVIHVKYEHSVTITDDSIRSRHSRQV